MDDDLRAELEAGRDALAACDWGAAAEAFLRALELEGGPAALDGLGQARYWQGDHGEALRLGERAYAGYREQGEWDAAARTAVRLAQVHGLVHGNAAAVSGWLAHARRAASRSGDGSAPGWVTLFAGCISPDPRERERCSREALELGRRLGIPGLEYDALAYLGKARVEQGDVAEGMALLDEAVAAAAAGLLGDPWAEGEVLCSLFHACEMTVDYVRAESWLAVVDAYVDRTRELPIAAICRMHYGGLLTAAGRWDRAEEQLRFALGVYEGTYVGTRHEPVVRLAELRVRQGRYEDAGRLLSGLEDHPAAAVVRARLELVAGRPEVAAALLDRWLPGPPCPPTAATALALRVEVANAAGSPEDGDAAAGELDRLAMATGLASLRGLAAVTRGRRAAVRGEDPVPAYEVALASLLEADLAHEAALVRLELARAWATTARVVACREAREAHATLVALGADRDADAAAGLLRELGERVASGRGRVGALTERQAQVLVLLAEGCSNAEIAERLVISPRTAEHHVSNILTALGVRTRTEAAATALREGWTSTVPHPWAEHARRTRAP